MKIKDIQLNNYRAFLVHNDKEIDRYTIKLPKGENLLLYGENGSGKSSLFKGMKDFFISANNTKHSFSENIFYEEDDNSEKPFICITLDDGTKNYYSLDSAKTDTDLTLQIKEANITKGFISYRDLLKLHYREDNQLPDFFAFFFSDNGLFADNLVATPLYAENKTSFKDLFKKIRDHQDPKAMEDYNLNAAAKFPELEKKANLLLSFFDKELSIKIDYTDFKIDKGKLLLPEIIFKPNLFEEDISLYHDFLNEARLTSIAISVYLSYILSLPKTELRILFLDDIFIGLDMSNRVPLIEILTSPDLGDGTSFKDFQIFITTYDREWYGIAKTYLKENWQKAELYIDSTPQKTDRPLLRRNETYLDRAEFHFANSDYPACANYMRKEYESLLRNLLPNNILYSGYSNKTHEESLMIISKNGFSISDDDEAWFFKEKAEDKKSRNSKFLGLQALIEKFNSLVKQYEIPFPVESLLAIKNRLLNPLSHDDLKSSIFKRDLIIGFELIKELRKIYSKTLIHISDKPVYLLYDKMDYKGKTFRYKFQLLGNLTYIEYGVFNVLLKSKCTLIRHRMIGSIKIEPSPKKEYDSIAQVLLGINIHSLDPIKRKQEKDNIIITQKEIMDSVYTEKGALIKDLIQHGK